MNKNPITEVIKLAGSVTAVGKAVGLRYQSIRKWERNGRLPRTEWTGETRYAEILEEKFGVSKHLLAPGAYNRIHHVSAHRDSD